MRALVAILATIGVLTVGGLLFRQIYEVSPVTLTNRYFRQLLKMPQGPPTTQNQSPSSVTNIPSSVTPTTSEKSVINVGAPVPLGIGIASSDILNFYNSKALPTDIAIAASSTPARLDLLKSAKGVKIIMLNPDATKAAQEMDLAKASAYLVSGNIEDPNLSNTLSKQQEQYQLAKSKGLIYIFGPAGIMLRDSYASQDYALARNTDILVYQTQYLQDNPREIGTSLDVNKYAQTVKDIIAKTRPHTNLKQVKVQVSVNPPSNRCMSADRVIQYIDSLGSDRASGPDAIIIFYSTSAASSGCTTSRTQVMEEVFSHYRP